MRVKKMSSNWTTSTVPLAFRTKKHLKSLRKGCRLFSLAPKPRMGLRHITIDNAVLRGLLKCANVANVPVMDEFLVTRASWWDLAFHNHKPPGKESTVKANAKTRAKCQPQFCRVHSKGNDV